MRHVFSAIFSKTFSKMFGTMFRKTFATLLFPDVRSRFRARPGPHRLRALNSKILKQVVHYCVYLAGQL
jgi:hypothetical protein